MCKYLDNGCENFSIRVRVLGPRPHRNYIDPIGELFGNSLQGGAPILVKYCVSKMLESDIVLSHLMAPM